MRPIFAIYLAAGLTLTCGLVVAGGHSYHAYATRYAIASLDPHGDALLRLEGIVKDDLEIAGWSLALAVSQVVIIVGARKLNQRSHSA